VLQSLLELHATRLVITHDQSLAWYADRVLWLEGGRLQDVSERVAAQRRQAGGVGHGPAAAAR